MNQNQDEITALVRQVVKRTLGSWEKSQDAGRVIVNEETMRQVPRGTTYDVPPGALVTPLANQLALERKIQLVKQEQPSEASGSPAQASTFLNITPATDQKMVAMGADHGGYELKERLKEVVAQAGYGVIDCGTHSKESVDYPDFAYAVARLIADGRAWRGILIDGAGIGSCMAANKVPGVRAAMCYDQATAVNSREHNNANVLTLGAGLIGPSLAGQIVQTWLTTEFGGGRHARRVDKIDMIGERYLKGKANKD